MEKKPLIVLAGPTACGKTGVSIALAKKIGGEIISADSMQVYRHMDIGTAKVMSEEMNGVPHHLIDVCDPEEAFHVVRFQEMAKAAVSGIYQRGRLPILVGGTGFYINSIVYDNNFMETCQDTAYRQSLYTIAKAQGANVLYEKLLEIDPLSAKDIHPHNIKRVVRAIEFYHLTGMSLHTHNMIEKEKSSPYQVFFFILTMDRQVLYQRIERRIDQMIENGLVEEVSQLLQQGYTKDLVSMQGLGYKEIIPYLQGEYSLEHAVYELKKRTRHFAKRQLTWFKHQAQGTWLDVTNLTIDQVSEKLFAALQKTVIL